MVKLDIVGIDVENVNRDVICAFTEQPTDLRKSERSREKKREPRCPSCDYRGSDAITRTYVCLTQTPLIRSRVRSDTRIIGALGAALITIAISANNVYANSVILTVLSLNRISHVYRLWPNVVEQFGSYARFSLKLDACSLRRLLKS